MKRFSRTELLLGRQAMEKLSHSRVAIFGIGGVGGYVAEALARSGVGAMDLIDKDRVSLTNLNRQIIALESTIGRYKTEVMKERILDVNPSAQVTIHNVFFLPENAGEFPFSSYDYVVDCVDVVTAKLELVMQARQHGVPIISSMGAGNKLDPTAFQVADVYDTSVCPLARVMRRELKKRGVESLKVVYSKEPPRTPDPEALEEYQREQEQQGENVGASGRVVPASCAFVPSVAGLVLASAVIQDLIGSSET